jgi:hypothetical protein
VSKTIRRLFDTPAATQDELFDTPAATQDKPFDTPAATQDKPFDTPAATQDRLCGVYTEVSKGYSETCRCHCEPQAKQSPRRELEIASLGVDQIMTKLGPTLDLGLVY